MRLTLIDAISRPLTKGEGTLTKDGKNIRVDLFTEKEDIQLTLRPVTADKLPASHATLNYMGLHVQPATLMYDAGHKNPNLFGIYVFNQKNGKYTMLLFVAPERENVEQLAKQAAEQALSGEEFSLGYPLLVITQILERKLTPSFKRSPAYA